MVHREYDAFGIDMVTPGQALAALSEIIHPVLSAVPVPSSAPGSAGR
jgi:hypothetical protein